MNHVSENEVAAWTVLVYMAGDNNLTEEMAWGLQELKKTAARLEERRIRENCSSEDRINVVAHFDPRGSRSRRYDFVPPSTINRISPKIDRDGDLARYQAMIYTRKSEAAGNAHEVCAVGGGAKSFNPLYTFVSEQLANRTRAKRYFLILSGHGSGAAGDFLTDSDPRTSLSIPKLATILAEARAAYRKAGEGSRKIDILGMDSCLMSNAEVCFEISEDADYLVASEGWVANAGWPYHRVLEALVPESGDADPAVESVARWVANSYSEFYEDYEIAGISTDIAVCRLQKFREDASLVKELQARARECIGAFDAVFVRDVLSRTGERAEEESKTLVSRLWYEIACLLCESENEAQKLWSKLSKLSDETKKAIERAPEPNELSASQLKAVRDVLESMGEPYGRSSLCLNEVKAEHWDAVRKTLVGGQSPSVALAAVKLLREFDRGVLKALELIETQQRDGRSEAMQARSLLQKLHQVRWVLELKELAKNRGGDHRDDDADVQLLNAVVASRWRAQSFKGGVYVDLQDFCQCLSQCLDEKRRERWRDTGRIAADAVAMSRTTGATSQHAHGLSVYFPCQAADYTSEYDNLAFAKKTGWGRLVRAYLRATRRERKGENSHWANVSDQVLRFGNSEVDPLEADGIEARIVGVLPRIEPVAAEAPTSGKEGTSAKIREGTSAKIREGTSAKIRGEGVLFVWGNPPDGFFKRTEDGTWAVKGEEAGGTSS